MTTTKTPETTPTTTEPEPEKFMLLADALAAFQASMPTIAKGQEAVIPGKDGKTGYKYEYADLTDIVEVCGPLLGAQGLSVTAKTKFTKTGMFILVTTLLHTSGEKVKSVYPLPDPMRTQPQQMGSAMTYARRYTYVAVTGIAPGGDDDDAQKQQATGQPAAGHNGQQQAARQIDWVPLDDYDLKGITTRAEAEDVYQKAAKAGHLNKAMRADTGQIIPFGQYIVDRGKALAAKEAEENRDDPTPPPADEPVDDGLTDEERAERAEIAAHEAEMAAKAVAPEEGQ